MPIIRVLDYETTGLGPESEVCESAFCDVTGEANAWTIGAMGSSLHEVDSMPPDARAAHHISLAETRGHPRFDPEAMWAKAKEDGVTVVAAHNAAFDGQFWGEPQFPVICTFKAARRVWPLEAPSHSNGTLRYWLQDRGQIAPDRALCYPPHRAGPDAYVTAHILLALLKETTGKQMVSWTRQPVYMPTCPIGKQWRGKPWKDVDGGFLNWVLQQSDMDADTAWNAREELERRKPKPAPSEEPVL